MSVHFLTLKLIIKELLFHKLDRKLSKSSKLKAWTKMKARFCEERAMTHIYQIATTHLFLRN